MLQALTLIFLRSAGFAPGKPEPQPPARARLTQGHGLHAALHPDLHGGGPRHLSGEGRPEHGALAKPGSKLET